MSSLLSVTNICERALRKMGAYSINDTGADPEELQEAAYWLDLVVAQMVATERCTWLVEDTITIPMVADQGVYNLKSSMGASYPSDGVLFIISAWMTDGVNDLEIGLIRRQEYEEFTNKSSSGLPENLYIDRLSNTDGQSFSVYPVPVDATRSLKVVIQRHAPNLADQPGTKAHGFHLAWQLWLILATAAEIADGPVRRLPSTEVDRIRRDAQMSFDKLQANQNRENVSHRRVRAWGA